MFSPKKLILSMLVLAITLLGVGCLESGKLSTIEYNNAMVSLINDTSSSIEKSTTAYDETIPNIVTETSKIDTTEIEKALAANKTSLEIALSTAPTLLSSDETQKAQVDIEFEKYIELANAYMETYEKMVTYYKNTGYQKSLDQVATLDRDLHNGYNDFIQSNNTLIDVLANFVK